jgi:hypothetical protein
MQSSPLPCYLVPLRLVYPLQHPILENPQPAFLNVSDQFSQPYETMGKIIVMYISIVTSLDSKMEDKFYPE